MDDVLAVLPEMLLQYGLQGMLLDSSQNVK
jgi:hypothetical protein